MRNPALLPVLLAMIPAPIAARAAETHIPAPEFSATAPARIGERVTVDDCHLVFATENEATCIGLPPSDASAAGRPVGRLLIRIAASDGLGPRRAVALCDGGVLDDACHVSISGIVEDQSSAYGLAERAMLGLREGTINWPD